MTTLARSPFRTARTPEAAPPTRAAQLALLSRPNRTAPLMAPGTDARTPSAEPARGPRDAPASVFLVPYPKIVFLYPTLLASFVAAVCVSFMDPTGTAYAVTTAAWLGLFTLNLSVLAFDFPRTTSLTLFCALFAVGMGLILLNVWRPAMLPDAFDVVTRVRPRANPAFFWTFTGILGSMLLIVLAMRRFDYWEVRPNELLHHQGFLSNLKRYSAPQLKIEKEIDDIFEWVLLGSGTLILHPKNEPRSIVLENVPGISRKERQITKMLSALQVSVRADD